MKFKFKLEKVLQHRKIQEDLAQKDFQEAVAKLNIEKDNLEKMLNDVFQARQRAFEIQTGGGIAGSGLSQVHDFMMGQDIRMERQRKKIQYQETIVEELREILRQKAQEFKIIEELKEKKREQFKVEKNKLEIKRADDINSMRFVRSRKE